MKPYILKLDTVKRKARTAYKAGLLTAQAPKHMDRNCLYQIRCHDGVERHCAIGASLPKHVIEAVAEDKRLSASVQNLADNGYVQWAAPEERSVINHIQSLHDSWCTGYENAHHKFKQAIGLK